MTAKEQHDYAQMFHALKRILAYDTPDRLRRTAEKRYGVEFGECLEMAYENLQKEAMDGLFSVRRPKVADTPATE
jgi:hypothetical protein